MPIPYVTSDLELLSKISSCMLFNKVLSYRSIKIRPLGDFALILLENLHKMPQNTKLNPQF